MLVPDEVKKASHDLRGAMTRARYHIKKAEESLHPVEELIRMMRNEEPPPSSSPAETKQ